MERLKFDPVCATEFNSRALRIGVVLKFVQADRVVILVQYRVNVTFCWWLYCQATQMIGDCVHRTAVFCEVKFFYCFAQVAKRNCTGGNGAHYFFDEC